MFDLTLMKNEDLKGEELSQKIIELENTARETRKWVIKMIHTAGSGHPGGSLSAVDILTTLYFYAMNHRPKEPTWVDRDRFILSKGHAAPALYATLAQAGYFDIEELKHLRELGSMLQGHPDMKRTPGIEASTGSEGQGLSMGIGMALGARLDRKFNRVFVMVGDGELNCGQTWEAAMAAAHFKLDNLTVFVDANGLQLDGPTLQIMATDPIGLKWKAFGWHVIEIDGHDIKDIIHAIDRSKKIEGKPTVIIAKTIKGRGVSFMEGAVGFHESAE